MSLLSELKAKVKEEYRIYVLQGKKGTMAVMLLSKAYSRGRSTIWRWLKNESK